MKNQSRFAKKSLGQNFLNNESVRRKILAEAGDIKDMNILEIGPGLGFLTEKILEAGANLTAIDYDERVIPLLEKKFGVLQQGTDWPTAPSQSRGTYADNFTLMQGDILDTDLDKLFGDEPYAIIANIPYNITNPILRKVLEKTKNQPQFSIFMVQKEVGEKICPPSLSDSPQKVVSDVPGYPLQVNVITQSTTKKFKRSILSIAVEVFAEARYGFTVPRTDFDPSPRVDSAIIRLDIRPEPLVPQEDQRDFFTVINGGFSEKRKKIGNVVPKFFGLEPRQLFPPNLDLNRRAETLSIDEWKQITQNFQKNKSLL